MISGREFNIINIDELRREVININEFRREVGCGKPACPEVWLPVNSELFGKITSAVRETGASRHNGGPIKGPSIESLDTIIV